MLEELTLKNFKLFDEEGVTIKPGLITVFIGPNGTGKSSVLQALALMKQSRDQPQLKVDGPLVFGDVSDFVHRPRRNDDSAMGFGLTFTIDSPIPPFFPATGKFVYQTTFRELRLNSTTVRVEMENKVFIEGYSNLQSQQNATEHLSSPLRFLITSDSFANPITFRGQVADNPSYEKAVREFCAFLAEALKKIYIVPALRGFDRLAYQQLPNLVTETDLMMSATSEARANIVVTIQVHDTEAKVRAKVSDWLSQVTDRTAELRAAPNYHWALETSDGKERFNIVHDGFGTNQLRYLFTQVALAPASSLICVDEPEIHLHPKAQASLSSVLVKIAQEEEAQIMLSTHSEHILMGLVTAVARGDLRAEELAVYYFSREGDTARADRLEVTPQGQIKGGLKDFFETDIEEMQRYMEALSQENKQ